MNQLSSAPDAVKDGEKRTKLSAGDWEHEALILIASKGVQGLAVEPLARRMGITKGSFYWHFRTRDALLEQALTGWEEHDSRNLEASLGSFDQPRERLSNFFRRVGKEHLTHEVYRQLCAAAEHPIVRPVLQRVTDRRMAHLATAYRELGLDQRASEHQARMAYSAYLGFLQLQSQEQAPDTESDAFEEYLEHVIEQLID